MEPEQSVDAASVHSVVKRLRDWNFCCEDDINDAADMLEFFFGQMQMHSPKWTDSTVTNFKAADGQ